MVTDASLRASRAVTIEQRGASLIEVLVTLVVLAVGLLGLVGLMVQSQRSQVESYQRAQALIILDDMVNRITVNRKAALCYAISTTPANDFVGAGGLAPYAPDSSSSLPSGFCTAFADAAPRAFADLREWSGVLLGATEKIAGTENAGAMIGARGCIEKLSSPDNAYRVTVVWQGIGPTAPPPADASACAQGRYGSESLRRVMSTTLQVATLN